MSSHPPHPPPHLVAHSLAAMSPPATILVSLVLALAQGTLPSYENHYTLSSGAPQQMQTLPGGVGAEMSAGCSSGGCSSSGSKPWQTLPMPVQKPMWQQPWQTLPMALPQGRFPSSHGQAMSMDPQMQEVPRYGSVGNNLNHIRHIEVLPMHALRGMAPAIQSAMPRYANWNTLPMQFNRQPYAGGAMEEPRQSQMPGEPEKPHIPDMPAPQPPVQTLPTPWTRSYTPIGNSGRCFNQCRNRYNTAHFLVSNTGIVGFYNFSFLLFHQFRLFTFVSGVRPLCIKPLLPARCAPPAPPGATVNPVGPGDQDTIHPACPFHYRCPLRQPTWNQGPTTMCGMNRPSYQPFQQPQYPQYPVYGNGGHGGQQPGHGPQVEQAYFSAEYFITLARRPKIFQSYNLPNFSKSVWKQEKQQHPLHTESI